jgi:CBS domain containing-hemolysin-like protein
VGIWVCSRGLGAVAEPALAHLVEAPLAAAHAPQALAEPIAIALALVVVVYFHVVIGEMIPKNLAIAGPERAALLLAPALVLVARATSVLIRSLRGVTNAVLRFLRVEPKDELASAFTAEEVHAIVAESRREGLLEDEHNLLTGALHLAERCAGDVMVPWERLITVASGSTPEDVERLVARTGYSRFPVVAGPHSERAAAVGTVQPAARAATAAASEVVGYLHLKDLLYADDDRYDEPIPDQRVRALVSVAPGDDVEDVLAAMQQSGAHLARVVGARATTLGVVFLEDVLEELVGEVRDASQRAPRPALTRH